MKRMALMAAALLLMPAAGRAQEHKGHEQMQHAQITPQQHEDFVQSLIEKRAQLKLTDAQVTKLQAFKAKMQEHHKTMMHGMMMQHDSMPGMKHDSSMSGMQRDSGMMMHGDSAMKAMHNELMAIFSDAQRKQVEALMQEHMKACSTAEGAVCKVEPKMQH